MPRKKIAFVINTLKSGGAERVVSILSNELVDEYEITIITLSKMTPFYTLDDRIAVVPCLDRILPSANFLQSIRTNRRLALRIRTILSGFQADLCISFMTTTNILCCWAAGKLGIPVIISERNNPQFEDEHLSRFWKIMRRMYYPKADKVIVQTKGIMDYFASWLPLQNLAIIPNPINPDFSYEPPAEREQIVLNVGRLSYQKGQEYLIEAFTSLQLDDWKLFIIGEGPRRSELEQLVRDLKMQDRIFLPGRTAEIDAYYLKSSIFAFSSKYEGFPNALMEAMYFGLPCVSFDCPTGPSELIEDGVNGFLVPVGDSEQLADRLRQLSADKALRARIGAKAHESQERFTLKFVIKDWKRIIEAQLKSIN